MNWIQKILDKWACKHKWNLVRETDVYDISFGHTANPTYTVMFYCCTECGKWEKVKTT